MSTSFVLDRSKSFVIAGSEATKQSSEQEIIDSDIDGLKHSDISITFLVFVLPCSVFNCPISLDCFVGTACLLAMTWERVLFHVANL